MTHAAKTEDALQVAAGDVVAGKYRVERVLGEGAMGVVVAARHEDLGQKVAIKLLHPSVSASDDGRERFLREARAAAKLDSDHVARVFDVGTFGNKNAYMVMEHLEGSDLEKYLDARGPLPIDEAVDYVLEALEALAHAHAHGMVHRDIKPSNLFLTQRMDGTRRVKILDFGISKTESGLGVSSPGSSTLTSPQAVLGSPAYMAPEQIRSSKHVDQRADIWSVGVMLYELVTGKSPFLGETVGDTLARVLVGQVEPLANLRPDAPRELVDAIARCLEADEKKRFQTVAELAQALAPLASLRTKDLPQRISRVLGANTVVAPPRAIIPSDPGVHINVAAETLVATDSASSKGTQITTTSSGSRTESGRSSRPFFAITIAAVAGAAVIGFFMTRSGSDVHTPATKDGISATTDTAPKPQLDSHMRGSGSPSPFAPNPSAASMAAHTAPPEIVPVASPDSSAHAATAHSANAIPSATVAAAPAPIASTTKTIAKPTTSESKKTSPTANPTYPSGLLDGRD